MGTKGTAGFKPNHENYRSGKGITRNGYSIHGYRYGVEKPDPRVTRSKPYYLVDITILIYKWPMQ